MILFAFFITYTSAEKLKIVDKIHATFEKQAEIKLFSPTAIPPIIYRQNFLFDSEEPCLSTSDELFNYNLCSMQNFTQISISQFDRSAHTIGVFLGFSVENYRISGLNFGYGDNDGCDTHRKASIKIICGQERKLRYLVYYSNIIYFRDLSLEYYSLNWP